jgi:16S rRNA (cytidine1402-2'-O)-methyltransferase
MRRILEKSTGTLYVVGTPIGNLDDMSPRARKVLGRVKIIAAEDTRRTRGLLSPHGNGPQVVAYHDHNERDVTPLLIDQLREGHSVALVSDAGMPLISDPGWILVSAARAERITVVSVPGPSAVTAALSVAGLPTDRFVFEGFLPRRAGARKERLAALVDESRTMVFFESVHRLQKTLDAMVEAFRADRPAAIARELTKLYEATDAATLGELQRMTGDEIPLLGEFVVLVAGQPKAVSAQDAQVLRIYQVLSAALEPATAVSLTAELAGTSRNAVYRLTRVDKADERR